MATICGGGEGRSAGSSRAWEVWEAWEARVVDGDMGRGLGATSVRMVRQERKTKKKGEHTSFGQVYILGNWPFFSFCPRTMASMMLGWSEPRLTKTFVTPAWTAGTSASLRAARWFAGLGLVPPTGPRKRQTMPCTCVTCQPRVSRPQRGNSCARVCMYVCMCVCVYVCVCACETDMLISDYGCVLSAVATKAGAEDGSDLRDVRAGPTRPIYLQNVRRRGAIIQETGNKKEARRDSVRKV
jgi:hypothetical protein